MDEKNIIITTTDLKEDYEILDTLCVTKQLRTSTPKEEYFRQELYNQKELLKKQCKEIGGDAIISCCVSFTPSSGSYPLNISGTAVKLKSKN